MLEGVAMGSEVQAHPYVPVHPGLETSSIEEREEERGGKGQVAIQNIKEFS